MKRLPLVVALLPAVVLAGAALALEGKWTPQQLAVLDPGFLRAQGLAIAPEALWDDARGDGLLAAVVDIDSCTAALISAEGLLVTNHHCVLSILQRHAKPGFDVATDGFLASDRAAELPGEGVKALVPVRFSDVTVAVEAGVAPAADDAARSQAIERVGKGLVAECEKAAGRRCRVAAFDGGLQYVLVEALEYPDVRLAYAPPRAVGDFGGEVDNWMWPRHTGDFALLRVWAAADGSPAEPGKGNVPLVPRRFLRPAVTGVAPGQFVMAAGYPYRSYRSLTAAELGERAALLFPQRVELYGAWLAIMERAAAADEDARLALSERITSAANVEKNTRAQLAGLARGNLVEKKWTFERTVVDWASGRAEVRDAVAAHEGLDALVTERRPTLRRDLLLESMRDGSVPMAAALTLVRWARERFKPDLERKPGFMERDRKRLKEGLLADLKRTHESTEKALLTALLDRLAELPEGSRSQAVDRLLRGASDHDAVAGRVRTLFATTRVLDEGSQRTMFDESLASLRLRRDPLLEFAFAVDDELREIEARRERSDGVAARLRPRWLRAVHAFVGTPVAPDANGTLRVSLGHVMGYSPHDGVVMLPQTRVAGMLEKQGDREPFVLPPLLRQAAARAGASRWADAALGDVPVAFLADLDTTGGSSGSPILNGKGELVGLNFDRVWENVANDIGYDPDMARNVSLDVRFMLWYLEAVEGARARPLLAELGVAAPAE